MSGQRSPATFPGEVRQVGHVVRDIAAAMAEWLALGVGPWTVIEVTQTNGHYRGEPSDASTVIGFANVGPMQIELIEAVGAGRSVWHEARDLGRFGPHHLAYWTDDFDAMLGSVADIGLTVAQDGDGNGMARFVYFESPSGLLVEVMELTELSRGFMDGIRRSAEGWDGSERAIRR